VGAGSTPETINAEPVRHDVGEGCRQNGAWVAGGKAAVSASLERFKGRAGATLMPPSKMRVLSRMFCSEPQSRWVCQACHLSPYQAFSIICKP
jgi:hypothetical protein